MDTTEEKEKLILERSGEIRALKLAIGYMGAAVKSKSHNLLAMKESLAVDKASKKGKERHEAYKAKVEDIKGVLKKSREAAVRRELNELELKGIL